jgi:hypothetical protein
MKLQVSQTSGLMNLRVHMSSMRKRCTPSQSLNDMPCQDRSNFWDLIAPSRRYLTSSTLSQGTAKKRFKLKSDNLQDWRLKLRLAIPTCSSRYASSFLNGWNTMATSSYAMTTVSWKMKLKACYVEWWACLILLITFHQFQDARNRKSNQPNLGTIKSSNLYTEIVEFSKWNSSMQPCLPLFCPWDHLTLLIVTLLIACCR